MCVGVCVCVCVWGGGGMLRIDVVLVTKKIKQEIDKGHFNEPF